MPTVAGELSGKTIVFLMANEGIEQVELTRPWDAVAAAGGWPVLAAPKPGGGPGLQPPRQSRHVRRRGDDRRDRGRGLRRVGPARRRGQPGPAPHGRPGRPLREGVVPRRQARRRHLPRPLDPRRSRRRAGADAYLVAEPPDRRPKRRRHVGRRAGVHLRGGPNTLVSSRKPDDLDAFCSTLVEVFRTGGRGRRQPDERRAARGRLRSMRPWAGAPRGRSGGRTSPSPSAPRSRCGEVAARRRHTGPARPAPG